MTVCVHACAGGGGPGMSMVKKEVFECLSEIVKELFTFPVLCRTVTRVLCILSLLTMSLVVSSMN